VVLVVAVCYLGHPKNLSIDLLIDNLLYNVHITQVMFAVPLSICYIINVNNVTFCCVDYNFFSNFNTV